MTIFIYIIQILIFLFFALWVADNPGVIHIDWLGYQIQTHVGVWLFSYVVLAIILHVVLNQVKALRNTPSFLGGWWSNRRKKKQDIWFQKTLVFLSNEQIDKAAKYAKNFMDQKNKNPLYILIMAQIAEKQKNTAECLMYYQQLAQHDIMGVLGYLGLARVNELHGNQEQALLMIKEAERLHGLSETIIMYRYRIYNEKKQWKLAIESLKNAHKYVDKEKVNQLLAEIYWQQSCEYPFPENKEYLEKALQYNPAHYHACLSYVKECLQNNETNIAKKILIKAWQKAPHMDIFTLWQTTAETQEPLELVQHAHSLLNHYMNHALSYYCLVNLTIKAEMWGKAEVLIEDYFKLPNDKRAFDNEFHDWHKIVHEMQAEYNQKHNNNDT